MRFALPSCLLLAPLTVVAATAPDRREKSAVSMLPDGSELQGVLIPRYNERRELVGTLKADLMKLVNQDRVSATDVTIKYYAENQQPAGRIDLTEAVYDQSTGLIQAEEAVKVRSTRLNADGMGLHYDMQGGDGFLVGPARTWIPPLPETSMTPSRKPLRNAALAGAAALTIATSAAEPAETTAPAVPPPDKAAAESRATREELAQALADSKAAHTAVGDFLKKAEGVDTSQTEGKTPEAKPLDVQPGPTDTVISCDGGMYFDPEEGVFVYLKNVTVKDPRFSLTGANELKIFLEQKAGDKKDAKKMNLGEVTRITASGALVFEQKPEGGGDPIRASGAFFSYHVKDDQVVLSGGYPWVVQGGLALRARQPNLTLRIQPKTRKFQTEGQWDTILPLEQLQNKNR